MPFNALAFLVTGFKRGCFFIPYSFLVARKHNMIITGGEHVFPSVVTRSWWARLAWAALGLPRTSGGWTSVATKNTADASPCGSVCMEFRIGVGRRCGKFLGPEGDVIGRASGHPSLSRPRVGAGAGR